MYVNLFSYLHCYVFSDLWTASTNHPLVNAVCKIVVLVPEYVF
jgi:hypothetical protein